MENLELYEKVRSVPENAKKKITGGRLKGMTDINPMWRIKKLTEEFGVCGIGWIPKIVRTWLDFGENNEVIASVEIELRVKVDGEWSEPIPGIGGSKAVVKEQNGVYTDDECYKKAYTDALSVACKALGMGADVYWDENTKYTSPSPTEPTRAAQKQTPGTQKKTKWAQVNDLLKESELSISNVTDWIVKKFKKNIKINDLSDKQFDELMTALRKTVEGESGE
jgi:hypothetical protein